MAREPLERIVGGEEHSRVFFGGLALVALLVLGLLVFGPG